MRPVARRFVSCRTMKRSYSARVTGKTPSSKPSTKTRCGGRSSCWPRSVPIMNQPPGIGTNAGADVDMRVVTHTSDNTAARPASSHSLHNRLPQSTQEGMHMHRRKGIVTAIVVVLAALAAGGLGYNIGLSHGLAVAAAPAAGAWPACRSRRRTCGITRGGSASVRCSSCSCSSSCSAACYGAGCTGRRGWDARTRFDEWHRRAHDQMNDTHAQTPTRS